MAEKFGALLRRKKGGDPSGAPAAPAPAAAEDLALAEERNAWERDEWARRKQALDFDTPYVRQEMPLRLQNVAYRAERAGEVEEARIRHERQEALTKLSMGDDFVEAPFDPSAGIRAADEDLPPPPVEAKDGDKGLAEALGAAAYGGAPPAKVASLVYVPAEDVYGGAVAGYSGAGVVSKPGWAGIFDKMHGMPSAPNPFSGPIQYPQLHAPMPAAGRATEKGISPDVMQRLNEGRSLATLALNNHESAPALSAQRKAREAAEAYKAADAGYKRALEILMPARKMLADGPESSRVVRLREKDRLEKLVTQILDNWDRVKPYLIPDLPTDRPGGGGGMAAPVEVSDPLMDRLTSGMAGVSTGNGDAEFDFSSLPSVPTFLPPK